MTTYTRPITLAVGVLLCAVAAPGSAANLSITSRSAGFLTESVQLAPSGSSETLSAGLPHLRLDITLAELENVVISGSGVISYAYPYASVKIMSNAADVSIPASAGPGREFPTPSSDHVWHLANNAVFSASVNPLFVGVIENGCLGAPANFDLSLDSAIFLQDDDSVLGDVHLTDSVFGPGHYNLEYTIRAADSNGNASDITFRGHAQSYCTGQLNDVIATDWASIIGSAATLQSTPGTVAADSVTCRPGDSNWCSNGFQIACDTQDGGLSTEPDGGVTCTYPEEDSSGRTFDLTAEEQPLVLPPTLDFLGTATRHTASWVTLTCHGNCDAFAQACAKKDGGLSTEPDGGTTCSIQDNTCSGCD